MRHIKHISLALFAFTALVAGAAAADEGAAAAAAAPAAPAEGAAATAPAAEGAAAASGDAAKALDVTKAGTVDCSKTPAVNIKGNKLKVSLSGSCTSVTIAGNHGEIVIDGVTALTVTGKQNNVTVSRVDTVSVTGSKNNVTFTGTVDSSKSAPEIADKGKGNSVKSLGAAAVDAAKKVDPKKASADAKKAGKGLGDSMKKLGLGGH